MTATLSSKCIHHQECQFLLLSSPIPLSPISLEQVTYTFDTSELIVDTRNYSSQIIISDVLSIQNVALSFSVGLQDVSTLVVTFKGNLDSEEQPF